MHGRKFFSVKNFFFWSKKKFSVKKFSASGGGEGGTYRQKIKIKKIFQNMIFLPIIRLLVKEISEGKILVKNFSKSGGVPTGKKTKLRKNFKT